jgi:hypothetical protein
MMLFAQAFPPGAQLLQTSAPAGPVKLWATRGTDSRLHIVLINKDPTTSVTVSVSLPGQATPASLETLQAPALTATTDVTLGGQTFGTATATGRLSGRASASQVNPVLGTYSIDLPAGSAAMLMR